MSAKQEMQSAIQSMLKTASYEQIQAAIEIMEANYRAMEDIQAGQVYSGDAARQRVRDLARERHDCEVDR